MYHLLRHMKPCIISTQFTYCFVWQWTHYFPEWIGPCREVGDHFAFPLNSNWFLCTGLFKMIFEVKLPSGNSAPNSGNNHHPTIPFEGGTHSFKRQVACVSRNWRYESEPPLKPSPLTCYRQFGTNSIIVLMFVESQRVHIESTCKVCNKNLEFCSIK